MECTDNLIYEERISSSRTEALFVSLTFLFLMLFIWLNCLDSPNILRAVLLILFVFFLFYSVNYRTLVIRVTPVTLQLTFGIFTWTIPLGNIGECNYDDLPLFMKYGGAGIHFMLVRNRYRASFNFLEHPRVVITLIKKAGLVRDVSFTTRHPDEVIQLLQDAISSHNIA